MRKSVLFIVLTTIFRFTAIAQDCSESFSTFSEGMRIEMTHYDKKGEISGISKNKILGVSTQNDTLIAKMEAKMEDKKGKETFASEFDVKCYKGTVFFDMRTVLNSDMTQAFKGMEFSIESKDIEYPSKLEAGMLLPDADMTMTAGSSGITLMKMRFSMTNRKVEARESITTKAGTFDCYKITYDMDTKVGFARKSSNAIWMAPKIGTVRVESYDKKGNVEYKSELTLFEK